MVFKIVVDEVKRIVENLLVQAEAVSLLSYST